MSIRTTTAVLDDIDGTEGAEAVFFGWDNFSYRIDLSEKNRTAFEKAVAKYLDKATRVMAPKALKKAGTPKNNEVSAIRSWARENGFEVNERGRLSAEVRTAYEAAVATGSTTTRATVTPAPEAVPEA